MQLWSRVKNFNVKIQFNAYMAYLTILSILFAPQSSAHSRGAFRDFQPHPKQCD